MFDDNGNQDQDEADGGDGPCGRLFQGPSGATSGHREVFFEEKEEKKRIDKE